jgi:ethanolamine utilization protein EutA
MTRLNGRQTLVGLDFGTTTSRAVIAEATVSRNAVTGRMELSQIQERITPDVVFTPFQDGLLDEAQLRLYLDTWLADVDPRQVFGGGAMLTGLAAQATNAFAIERLTRHYVRHENAATARDR